MARVHLHPDIKRFVTEALHGFAQVPCKTTKGRGATPLSTPTRWKSWRAWTPKCASIHWVTLVCDFLCWVGHWGGVLIALQTSPMFCKKGRGEFLKGCSLLPLTITHTALLVSKHSLLSSVSLHAFLAKPSSWGCKPLVLSPSNHTAQVCHFPLRCRLGNRFWFLLRHIYMERFRRALLSVVEGNHERFAQGLWAWALAIHTQCFQTRHVKIQVIDNAVSLFH